jgi:hypothetical protein
LLGYKLRVCYAIKFCKAQRALWKIWWGTNLYLCHIYWKIILYLYLLFLVTIISDLRNDVEDQLNIDINSVCGDVLLYCDMLW